MEKYRTTYKNHKFKIKAPMWNDEFDLPNGSYSPSNIQNFIE